MNTLECYEYRNHEIIILEDLSPNYEGTFACDIRADNYDGELIAGFCELNTIDQAKQRAVDYIDNLYLYN